MGRRDGEQAPHAGGLGRAPAGGPACLEVVALYLLQAHDVGIVGQQLLEQVQLAVRPGQRPRRAVPKLVALRRRGGGGGGGGMAGGGAWR